MRNDMYEGLWSPFDPTWYQEAFDKYISTGDELENKNDIAQKGYHVHDVDGSRNSLFRKDAVLNNSFNEKILIQTLRDIYNNSSHKLIASNHDSAQFFQWSGYMSNMTFIPNTNICEFSIPTDTFIRSKDKDRYRLSSYWKKWIKIEDILNHWDIFPWHCLMFIDQKICSEYMFHIDDQETIIRFKYYDYWKNANLPVYIYKFPTNAQYRVLISRELVINQWNWKMPVSYVKDKRIINSDHVMIAINKISDLSIRTDGIEDIEIIGENLEFIKIENGYIDLSKISKANKIYLESETKEWLWLSIIIPKNFHEYPILLPTDVIYRPYEANFRPVVTMQQDNIQHVKAYGSTNKIKQVYVDLNGEIQEVHNSWKKMIRPIVLSDAFDHPNEEVYSDLIQELNEVRDATVKAADILEQLRNFMIDYTTDEKFDQIVSNLDHSLEVVHTTLHSFMDKRLMEYDESYERRYEEYKKLLPVIIEDKMSSEYLHAYQDDALNFYSVVSPCIYIPREFVDQYYSIRIVNSMKDTEKVLWEDIDKFMDHIRFQRPIDVIDFWTFEYDLDKRIWKPYPLKLEYHFPDVYILKDPLTNQEPVNRIFKAFFFYSDNMNVTDLSRPIEDVPIDWSEASTKYYFDQHGTYRDIFMEKFYWMGIRSIYKGLLMSETRWEVIEHIIDNSSYERFNELFMKTMDPYFKIGLATYLKSDQYNFPFDFAIEKLKESIDTEFLGYKRVTNFEAYLNRSWIPSYFDYVTKILDDWDWQSHLLRRPKNTFDIDRLISILLRLQKEVYECSSDLNKDIEYILNHLKNEYYNLNVSEIEKLKDLSNETMLNANELLEYTEDLDLEIYSIDDINHIIQCLKEHFNFVNQLSDQFSIIYDDASVKKVWDRKRNYQANISTVLEMLYLSIDEITKLMQQFDMDAFMKAINDLDSYIRYDKYNPDDSSLLGQVNSFTQPWSEKVKESRNKLFSSFTTMYGAFNPDKAYQQDELDQFISMVANVTNDMNVFYYSLREFWISYGFEKDQSIVDKLDYAFNYLNKLNENLKIYMDARSRLLERVNSIKTFMNAMIELTVSSTEYNFRIDIVNFLDRLILALSYIIGTNNRDEAIAALMNAIKVHEDWIQFVATEEDIFTRLLQMSEIPNGYISQLISSNDILEAAIEYMDTVNEDHQSDISWPTYSDVYDVNEIQIQNGGFLHKIGNKVYIPDIGSYIITDIDDTVSRAIKMDDLNYRKTMFKIPSTTKIYDGITDGNGMGVRVIPTKITHHRIINEEIITQYIQRVENIIYLVNRNIISVNPHANIELQTIIDSIGLIHSDWNQILGVYNDYITPKVSKYVTDLIVSLTNLLVYGVQFNEARAKLNFEDYITSYEKFIYDVYNKTEKLGLQTEQFFLCDNMLRSYYGSLVSHYDNGTSWGDPSSLKSVITESKNGLNYLEKRFLSQQTQFPDIVFMSQEVQRMIDLADSLVNTITQISTYDITNIKVTINSISNTLKKQPTDLQKDVWYKIKYVSVATEGMNYKAGDIIELIPEMPTDSEGSVIDDLVDTVMNDVILLQVNQVDNGRVVKCSTLLDYALPYQIWGIRNTKPRFGNGEGLQVDVYSYQVELSDSTLLQDSKSDISAFPPFDENDLFVFKFENIHDLDIGYEVFIGGKQITNVIQRHELSDNVLQPRSLDVLYLNANEVINLQNTSIYEAAEHYFIYKIDKVEIKDPGAGYAVGQDIYVDVDQALLRLTVAKLVNNPTKGIGEINLGETSLHYEVNDINCDHAKVIADSFNNIDDEYNSGYYDYLPQEGIEKPASKDNPDIIFTSKRFDQFSNSERNKDYMHPDPGVPKGDGIQGDPDDHFYLGSEINSDMIHDRRMNIIDSNHAIISEENIIPPNQPIHGEFQEFKRVRIHNSINETNTDVTKKYTDSIINYAMRPVDLIVPVFTSLPRHLEDYPEGKVGSRIIVENDETHEGHRMLYVIRTFVAAGFFIYDLPEVADFSWNRVTVDWMNMDVYHDLPTNAAQYRNAPWEDYSKYRDIQRYITDGKTEPIVDPQFNTTTYIHEITLDDLSVFNWTTKEWEDLHDSNRWELITKYDDKNEEYGFTLTFKQEGIYDYDMSFFFNKTPNNQLRNATLKKNASLSVSAYISGEVNTSAINTSVYTGRHLRIRKLFPFEQKETFRIGYDEEGNPLGYEMNFKLNPYVHFRNEIHLEDIKIYNRSAQRFENIMDPQLFEVRFKDDKSIDRGGHEIQTEILSSYISNAGEGFIDGPVWCWNEQYQVHLFGEITTNFSTGNIITFKPTHCPNPPSGHIMLEFDVYQHVGQSKVTSAVVVVEFNTQQIEVWGDGYIHHVTNRMAVVPDEFKIICQYNLDGPGVYDVIISKRSRKWVFTEPNWLQSPTFHLDDCNIQQNHLYILTNNGRFPLINPSTGKPTMLVTETANGTNVTFLNLYKRYEHLEVRSVPYPMRSVYVQRHIPQSGYIDLAGKLNKPLNKKYFEFWVNGKLLFDEVTIITPTKLFLHGLTSLKNLEIIEINRDPNEYFSDGFLEVSSSLLGDQSNQWNFRTYLDDALEGELERDNYTPEEQEYLLTPVWKQVEKDHPEFKNYPPNVDTDTDILVRTTQGDNVLAEIPEPNFQFVVMDSPTIEGYPINNQNISFKHFGFIPIDDNMLIDMMNEEWSKEMAEDPYFPEHSIMSDDEWYGMAARLYDEYGILVHNLNEAAYSITDTNLLMINIDKKTSRIVNNSIVYDLT